MSSFQTVRGMRDLLPQETKALLYTIAKARETARLYCFQEVITPVVESNELLAAKSGEEIRARMFTFKDLGERTVSLRPEFTASIARLTTTTMKNEPKPLRLFSTGSVYRYDEPQRGRYREFWQSNFEMMGSNKPEADAEIILLTNTIMKKVGLANYAIKLGHVGVIRGILNQEGINDKTQNAILQRMDKKEYDAALGLLSSQKAKEMLLGLVELKNTDPYETVKKMKEHVQKYQSSVDATENLKSILSLVAESGCKIETVDPAFARGLEYYTGMIFEVYVPQLDIALGGGGRYDKLIEVFGGESTPAVGVAHGLDRITIALQTQDNEIENSESVRVVVIPVKENMKGAALKIAQRLRDAGIFTDFEVMGRKMGKALEDADKRNMDFAVIVGEREIQNGMITLKNLRKREQSQIKIQELIQKVK